MSQEQGSNIAGTLAEATRRAPRTCTSASAMAVVDGGASISGLHPLV